jgi:hypothetical protein
MWEDLVKETEVIARAEAIRRSLSEETLHERGTKAVPAYRRAEHLSRQDVWVLICRLNDRLVDQRGSVSVYFIP